MPLGTIWGEEHTSFRLLLESPLTKFIHGDRRRAEVSRLLSFGSAATPLEPEMPFLLSESRRPGQLLPAGSRELVPSTIFS
jgi:hypothetical protein